MRTMEFKMERPGLVEIGQTVPITEKKTALNYSYMIQPAVAMSGCYKVNERVAAREGVVKDIRHNDRGYYVILEFEEEEMPENRQ